LTERFSWPPVPPIPPIPPIPNPIPIPPPVLRLVLPLSQLVSHRDWISVGKTDGGISKFPFRFSQFTHTVCCCVTFFIFYCGGKCEMVNSAWPSMIKFRLKSKFIEINRPSSPLTFSPSLPSK